MALGLDPVRADQIEALQREITVGRQQRLPGMFRRLIHHQTRAATRRRPQCQGFVTPGDRSGRHGTISMKNYYIIICRFMNGIGQAAEARGPTRDDEDGDAEGCCRRRGPSSWSL